MAINIHAVAWRLHKKLGEAKSLQEERDIIFAELTDAIEATVKECGKSVNKMIVQEITRAHLEQAVTILNKHKFDNTDQWELYWHGTDPGNDTDMIFAGRPSYDDDDPSQLSSYAAVAVAEKLERDEVIP